MVCAEDGLGKSVFARSDLSCRTGVGMILSWGIMFSEE